MLKQLEKEGEEDEEIYDKMACWCETNDKEKTKSIAEAEAKIEKFTTIIEETTAQSARLNTEIENLEQELAKNQKSLGEATSLREKQLAEFNGEEKDLLESISALTSAITVLGKHNGASLIQMSHTHAFTVASALRKAIAKHSDLLRGVFLPSQRKAVYSFIQSPDYFDAEPTFKQSYAPQSGQIFGIIAQMKETFEANLAASQKEEAENQQTYQELKAAKEEEIKAGQDQIDAKTQQKADTDEKNAGAKTDLKDTRDSLSADEKFLMMLKEKCQMTDKEWESRQKTRQLEMEAVSKALSVLSGDDAHDLFTNTFNPALVQSGRAWQSQRKEQVSALLLTVAKKLHSPRLSQLAFRVRLDAFARVKKAIDDMIADLTKEKEDEIKHKDFCVEEFHKNHLQTERFERSQQDLTEQINGMELKIKELTEAIETLKAEIKEMQLQLKRAGEDRELQNKEFQTTVADQRATQKLLRSALTVLQDFYGKKEAALVQQTQEPSGPPPPPGFEAYSKSAASGGVMSMIQQIISDAQAMEADAIRSEEDAQKAYEDFVKETNESVEAKSKGIVNKSQAKAKTEEDLAESKQELDGVMLGLEHLHNYDAELHQSCDYLMKNFDVRQTARDEEVEALRQAKAILSGAKFQEFLQTS